MDLTELVKSLLNSPVLVAVMTVTGVKAVETFQAYRQARLAVDKDRLALIDRNEQSETERVWKRLESLEATNASLVEQNGDLRSKLAQIDVLQLKVQTITDENVGLRGRMQHLELLNTSSARTAHEVTVERDRLRDELRTTRESLAETLKRLEAALLRIETLESHVRRLENSHSPIDTSAAEGI